jgi:hypothetical protein
MTQNCVGMKEVSLKDARKVLQKMITWIKKFRTGKQEWDKACTEVGLLTQRLKTLVKNLICK